MEKEYLHKKIIALSLLSAILVPFSLYAQSGGDSSLSGDSYFGGRQTMIYNEGMCNCSSTNVHVIMDDATNGELMLYYSGSGRLYDSGNIDNTGGLQLGSYQTETTECQEYVGEDCVTIATATGTYSSGPGTGTSMFENTRKVLAGAFNEIIRTLSSNAKA